MISRTYLMVKYARKIHRKETLFNPKERVIDSEGDSAYPCPDDGAALEYWGDEGWDPDTVSIYRCPKCKGRWSSESLFAIEDAFKAMAGEDPFKGSISHVGDGFFQSYSIDWKAFKKLVEQEEEPEPPAPRQRFDEFYDGWVDY